MNSEPISQREFFRESVKRLFGADSILKGKLAKETEYMVRTYAAQLKAEVIELNVQIDHVHLLAMIPPKVSISKFMGVIKGKAAIRILNKYKDLRMEPY